MQDDIQVRVQSTPWYTGFELLIGGVNSKIEKEMRRKMAEQCAYAVDNFMEVRTMRDVVEIRVRRPVDGNPF